MFMILITTATIIVTITSIIRTSEFSKAAGYRVHMKKSIIFLYTNNKQLELLNSFVEVQLTYNKLYIFKMYNFTYTYPHKTITTIKKMNLDINLKSFL